MIAKTTSKKQLTLRGDAVRARLTALHLTEADVAGAVRWMRSGIAAPRVAAPPAAYAPAKTTKTAAKRTGKPRKKKTSPRA